jgi:23S rRNA pseudouridine2605 synthase
VNGQVARLGARAREGDRIQVDGRPVRAAVMELPRVLIYHKPAGEIVSRNDPQGRPSVFDGLPPLRGAKWIAVGRLDFNTEGLLIFTTSGDLANRLMHPGTELEREYSVRILGEITLGQLKQLHEGVELSDGPARFESVEDAGGRGANRWYRVTIKEGRNREVRRIFEALGFTVSRLIRVRFGPIGLPPMLRRGRHRELLPNEVGLLAPELSAKSASGREPSRGGERRRGPRQAPREAGPGSEGTRNPRRPRFRAR